MSDALFWMVPSRRAVVRRSITYADLVRAWITALQADAAALRRWYNIAPANFLAGTASIEHWLQTAFSQEGSVGAARDATTTLDLSQVVYYVRLWKGPLRVLLEHAARPQPLGDEIANHSDIQIDHGGQVRLVLNTNGEVTNTDARFLIGDVVEFSLFKFLGACGLGAYGTAPAYDDKLTFNGQGNFLLNTALKDAGGASPPASPLLHDNLVAMRFQLLLNGCLGAFYHLDAPVFVGQARAVEIADGARRIYARGFLYAGTLARPSSIGRGLPEHWRFENYGWCVGRDGNVANNVPSLAGLAKLSDGFVITPGSTCSPTTLFLSNYMMRHYSAAYGSNSVGHTLRQQGAGQRRALIEDSYELVTPEQVAALVPAVPEEEMRARLNRLIEHVRQVLALVDGDQSFMHRKLAEAQAWPEWQADVRPESRRQIERRADQPAGLIEAVGTVLTGRRTPAAESAVAERLHAGLVEGAQNFGRELHALLESAEWGDFTSVAPDFSNRSISRHVQNVQTIECPGGRCRQRHSFSSIDTLRSQLRSKLRNLERRRDDTRRPLSGGPRGRTLDFSAHLSDVNTVSLNGHEFGIVRLYPHEKLLQASPLPRAGFMAAYHPISGQPFVPNPGPIPGQFFVFESGDLLYVWSGDETRNTFGSGPFKWHRIERNRCSIQVAGRGVVNFGDGEQPRSKTLQGLIKIRGQSASHDSLADAQVQEPQAFRPILIYPIRGASTDDSYRSATNRLVRNGSKLYAARAVPYPTLAEVADAFATKDAARREQEGVRQAAVDALATLNTDLLSANQRLEQAAPANRRAAEREVATLTRKIDALNRFIASLTPPSS